ncbi:iron-sulfur cluster assembly scaffold protein [Candidatus Pacearchaeota archaeon RBG_19FT_COMBO_34_9]|nr:MAG: iron-sulfur cluster assembly scaffold protein [Candidatus Pacearchaeota archaeon RBG_19FT_COMBO_34_9]OGJ16341.1 MAG: iron-sulfur cluster assembly scaffold protein [Candidatus Pacearchaeota archaeon RBG_13_33_26]
MTILYSKKVMQEFTHPRNMGEIKDADGIGKVGNPVCGDVMWLYIKVRKNTKGQEIIKDIKFKTFGCAAAIATSSMITQLAKGKTLKEAEKITRNDVADSLKGLPSIKMHCSNLSSDALKRAIEDYEKKKKSKKEIKLQMEYNPGLQKYEPRLSVKKKNKK